MTKNDKSESETPPPRLDADLLAILVCPSCKGALTYQHERRRLLCRGERLAYPITADNIPVLLAEEAVAVSGDD